MKSSRLSKLIDRFSMLLAESNSYPIWIQPARDMRHVELHSRPPQSHVSWTKRRQSLFSARVQFESPGIQSLRLEVRHSSSKKISVRNFQNNIDFVSASTYVKQNCCDSISCAQTFKGILLFFPCEIEMRLIMSADAVIDRLQFFGCSGGETGHVLHS